MGLVAYAWNIANNSPSGLGDDILGIGDHKGLNNGNIAFMLVNVPQFERQEPNLGITGFAYQYDQLHRIRQSVDYRGKDGKSWEKADLAKTGYTYDPNGNILTLQRTAPNAGAGSGSTDIDDLSYSYDYPGTNRLSKIKDSKGATHAGFGDLANQADNNYAYNAIGQLGYDASQSIYKVFWTIQGKVHQVVFSNGNSNVDYTYDPLGNRLTKKVADTTTYYIRDAQGNSFATYKRIRDNINNYDTTRLIEQYLYASSRLGVRSADIIVKIRSTNALLPDSARCFSTAVGAVSFEQTNHLGDVVVTLSDKVLGADVDADNAIDYYKSIVKSASLTYPFGWDIPNRKFSNAPDYRFGFNGKENDAQTNSLDFGARNYDARIARWWSVDPEKAAYPNQSPYVFALNSPIKLLDANGGYVTDENGNIIFVPTGAPRFKIHSDIKGQQTILAASDKLEEQKVVGATEKAHAMGYIATEGYIFADDGTKVLVYFVEDQTVYDAEFTLKYTTYIEDDVIKPYVNGKETPTTKTVRGGSISSPNCAGLAMVDGKFVLHTFNSDDETSDAGVLLVGDSYKEITDSPTEGDIGVYYNKTKMEHVEVFEAQRTAPPAANAPSTVSSKGGITPLITGQAPKTTWDNFTDYKIYRKSTPNKKFPLPKKATLSNGVATVKGKVDKISGQIKKANNRAAKEAKKQPKA